jgi:hypothetical protein
MTPAARSRRGSRSTCVARSARPGNARCASTTPAAPAGPRSADHATARDDDRDRRPAPRSSGNRPQRRWSRRATTTRRLRASARRRRTRPCRTARSRHHYRDRTPGVSSLKQPSNSRKSDEAPGPVGGPTRSTRSQHRPTPHREEPRMAQRGTATRTTRILHQQCSSQTRFSTPSASATRARTASARHRGRSTGAPRSVPRSRARTDARAAGCRATASTSPTTVRHRRRS